ncbi:MAG: DUF1573 domain-containing protein [Bacteroidaceae bacterium]|nr:DUF1573 domain-containing protein [Bacteroidaceae bacterium]
MRRILPLFLALVATLTLSAQSGVRFLETRVDCGQVKWKQPVTAKFTLTNEATRTVSISQVRPDCSCTAVAYTQTPVAPGGKAQIEVRYDAELLGTFEKQVAVYTTASPRPVYVTMRGRVMMQPEAIAPTASPAPIVDAEDFNYTVGDIHLSTDHLEFDDVQLGDSPTIAVRLLNTGDQPYAPTVMHLPMWLKAEAVPELVHPGHTGDIIFRLRADYVGDYGLTQTSVYLQRFPGDVVGGDNEMSVSATIVPHRLSAVAGPVPAVACDTAVSVGRFSGKEQLKTTLIVRNTGSAPLEIRKLQVYNPGILASLSTTRIKAGGKAKLTVTATPALFDSHARPRILLITNDPARPKVIVEVQAEK